MPVRVLHLDCSRGVSAASVLGALVDMGVAPSPILRAVADLGLPVELRVQTCADGTTVHAHPGAPLAIPVLGALPSLPEEARRVAEDALGRLVVAEGATALNAAVDARALACIAGAALGIASLGADGILVSRVGVQDDASEPLVDLLADWTHALDFGEGFATTDGAALLRALAPEQSVGRAPPAWSGYASRGRSCDESGVGVALGDATDA